MALTKEDLQAISGLLENQKTEIMTETKEMLQDTKKELQDTKKELRTEMGNQTKELKDYVKGEIAKVNRRITKVNKRITRSEGLLLDEIDRMHHVSMERTERLAKNVQELRSLFYSFSHENYEQDILTVRVNDLEKRVMVLENQTA